MENQNNTKINVVLLILVAVCPIVLGIIGIFFSTILLIIYAKTIEKHYRIQKALLTTSFVGAFLAFGSSLLLINTSGGLDGLGAALMYGASYNIGTLLLTVCPLAILLIDYRKFIFSPNTLMIVATLVIVAGLYFPIRTALTTTKVTDDR